jgi:hypothetical protein
LVVRIGLTASRGAKRRIGLGSIRDAWQCGRLGERPQPLLHFPDDEDFARFRKFGQGNRCGGIFRLRTRRTLAHDPGRRIRGRICQFRQNRWILVQPGASARGAGAAKFIGRVGAQGSPLGTGEIGPLQVGSLRHGRGLDDRAGRGDGARRGHDRHHDCRQWQLRAVAGRPAPPGLIGHCFATASHTAGPDRPTADFEGRDRNHNRSRGCDRNRNEQVAGRLGVASLRGHWSLPGYYKTLAKVKA